MKVPEERKKRILSDRNKKGTQYNSAEEEMWGRSMKFKRDRLEEVGYKSISVEKKYLQH